MKTYHSMNIIVQTTGVYESSIKKKSEIPNKNIANITRGLVLKSSHKGKIGAFPLRMTY